MYNFVTTKSLESSEMVKKKKKKKQQKPMRIGFEVASCCFHLGQALCSLLDGFHVMIRQDYICESALENEVYDCKRVLLLLTQYICLLKGWHNFFSAGKPFSVLHLPPYFQIFFKIFCEFVFLASPILRLSRRKQWIPSTLQGEIISASPILTIGENSGFPVHYREK